MSDMHDITGDSREIVMNSALYREFLAEREEILRHKWLESEKSGRDIGWQQAVTEWHARHYRAWKDHVRATRLNEPGRAHRASGSFRSKLVAGSRRRSFSAEHREHLAVAMRAWHEKRKVRRSAEG